MLAHFYKLPSIVQILVAEFLMTLALGGLAPYAYRALVTVRLSYEPLPLDFGDYLFAALGLALLVYLLWGVFRPRVVPVSWIPVFQVSGVPVPGIGMSVRHGFVTNHPSYVLIDLVVLGFWWFMFGMLRSADAERAYEAWLWVAVAAIVPVCRLIAWYVLRLRPVDAASEVVREAWKPPVMLWAFFVGPVVLLILVLYALG